MVKDNVTNGPMYYLPHHPVIKEDRAATKLRVVFDASSHEKFSCSSNKCLLLGPNLNPDLLNILIKFRQYPVAVTADIESACLQKSLNKRDRHKPMLQKEINVNVTVLNFNKNGHKNNKNKGRFHSKGSGPRLEK